MSNETDELFAATKLRLFKEAGVKTDDDHSADVLDANRRITALVTELLNEGKITPLGVAAILNGSSMAMLDKFACPCSGCELAFGYLSNVVVDATVWHDPKEEPNDQPQE